MLLKGKQTILEITPPSLTEKESYTTEQLFSLIQSLGKSSLKDKLLGKKIYFSLEIVSTRSEGIRYLIRTTPEKASILRKTLISYLPQITIKEIKDYLPESLEELKKKEYKIIDFKLANHFAFPLKKHNLLEMYDPISYITGMMTKLNPEELISLQIVLTPVKVKEAKKIQKFILKNADTLHYIHSPKLFRMLSKPPSKTLNRQSPSEKDIIGLINEKVEQPLFETSIRLLLISDHEENISERANSISSSFSSFSSSEYQSITSKKHLGLGAMDKLIFFSFKNRLTLLNKSYLSVSEISSLFHFPFANTVSTEDLVKTHSKELPTPLSLKTQNLDIAFAKNSYAGEETTIGLSENERQKHVYIIGATGTGKTTMIQSMVKEDVEKDKGLCVMDPHGDLAESIISLIPKSRKDDFIYFNPDDIKHPVGLNLLELSPSDDEDEILREKELITESVISLFRKIFSDVWSAHAHRLEYILRNTIQTALCLKDPNIFTVYYLLTDPLFKEEALRHVDDENLKNFWKNEFEKAGDYQKVKMIGPITSRIGRFLFSPTAKRIMEQTKSTINFEEIMDSGKILICNLSKGKIGEDNSEVLGIMILTKIQLASLKRARSKQEDRKSFYVYVDEFQNFATPSFIQMLSESRKYKVFLTMAEQSTSQQKDRNIVNVILANVGTVISFRSANPDDEKLMLPQFAPYIQAGEIANLPLYKFYIKISAVNPEEPFSGMTVPVEIPKDNKKFEELIQLSRDHYATIYVKQKPIKTITKPTTETSNKETIGNYSKDSEYMLTE
jgi:GTPase SAR1 family protein